MKKESRMNVICAVDIETTGLDPFRDEILQLAIVPLDFLPKAGQVRNMSSQRHDSQTLPDDVREVRRPLNIRIKALMPERMSAEVRKITGLDPCEGLNLFDARKAVNDWLRENNIEKVIPVGHNYTKFDGPFLRNSQAVNYDEVFSHHELDTLIIARFANKLCEFRKGQTCLLELPSRRLFTSLKLMDLAADLRISQSAREKPHDALSDATIAGEIFFKLLELFDFK